MSEIQSLKNIEDRPLLYENYIMIRQEGAYEKEYTVGVNSYTPVNGEWGNVEMVSIYSAGKPTAEEAVAAWNRLVALIDGEPQ